jgi:hypothetical protein
MRSKTVKLFGCSRERGEIFRACLLRRVLVSFETLLLFVAVALECSLIGVKGSVR